MANYVNLHTHTHYSALDGYNTPDEYLERAVKLGMTHLAITDHGTLSGHRDFVVAAKRHGVTPILGVEAYISETDRFDKRGKAKREDGTSVYNHITIIAKNKKGLENLNRLATIGWTEGFYFKPRIDREALYENKEGLVVLSGCMSGLIAKAILNDNLEKAREYAQELRDNLGDNFYIEIMSSNDVELNLALIKLAEEEGIPLVSTTDCHYANKEDLWKEEALLILSTGAKLDRQANVLEAQRQPMLERLNTLYPERKMSYQDIEIYLRDYETEVEKYAEQGIVRTDIFENTVKIASQVEDYPFYEGLDLLPTPKGVEDPDSVLVRLCEQGIERIGMEVTPEVKSRLESELEVIKGKNFSTYFLIVAEAIQWAKAQGIMVGPGRGSAVGSLVCYLLGITSINPLDYNLLFTRFINPERNDFPDVDVDIEDARRHEVKEHMRATYGNVASIITFTKFQGKSAIKAAARVLGVPFKDANYALKNNDFETNYFENFERSEKGAALIKKYPDVVKVARALDGRISQTGMHAAGLVLSKEDIFKFAPLETAKDPNDKNGPRVNMVAYDMNECAEIGLIKIDFLGLKAMTIVSDTVKLVKERTGRQIDLFELDLNDQNVYKMLSAGHTKGVFQCEAVPYTGLIIKMGGLNGFDELVASNALVRPGAMNTIGADYILCKNGKQMIEYPHMDMKSFTEETYSKVLYQEQVMLTMTEIAGMSMATADKVRKIIGKKKDASEFDQFRDEFIEGASSKINASVAAKLWHDFEAHSDYSFNKSHAVAYSMVSFWTAWLKYYYPKEFMASVLKNEDDKDSITDYLIETKRLGIGVLLPHINKSEAKVSIEGDNIRLGLENLKYISDKVSPKIIEARPFSSYQQVLDTFSAKGSGVNSRVIQAMNAVGAAAFHDNPKTGKERENLYEYLNIPAFGNVDIDPTIKFKFIDLEDYGEQGVFSVMAMVRNVVRKDGWARIEMLDETGSAGVFADEKIPVEQGQKYAFLVSNNRVMRFCKIDAIIDEDANNAYLGYLRDEVEMPMNGGYYVVAMRARVAKSSGKKMADGILMDHLGVLKPVIVFNYALERHNVLQKASPGSYITGKITELDDGTLTIKGLD